MNKRKQKSSKKKFRTSYKKHSKEKCRKLLSDKIATNIREMNRGKLKTGSGYKVSNRKQAIAMSYSFLKKKYPKCKF